MAPNLLAAALGLLIGVLAFSKDKPIPVKVVITMFERSADNGSLTRAEALPSDRFSLPAAPEDSPQGLLP